MKFGTSLDEALRYKSEDGKRIRKWFAWHPVQMPDQTYRWLCFVNRQRIYYFQYIKDMKSHWMYTEYKG